MDKTMERAFGVSGGMSPTDFALAINESPQTVTNWSKRGISKNGAMKVAQKFNSSVDWILSGNSIPHFTPVETWDSNTPLDDDEIEIPFFKDFAFACGSGSMSEAIANEKRKLRMSKATIRNLSITKENAVAATASGDSMSPTIKDGDTIHIDLGRKTVKDGKIFAVCIGGLFYCKRLYNMPFGGMRIVSDNAEEFAEIQLTAQQIEEQEFRIVGWIWQIATMERW